MQRHYEDWDAPPPSSPLGQRLARFVALMGATFAITAAVIVTRRLSEDSLALLIGLSCGVMAMLPTLALGFIVWRREDAQRCETAQQQEQSQRQFGYPGMPPVIVVAPQAMPTDYQRAFGAPNATAPWMPQPGHRTFTIVGDEE